MNNKTIRSTTFGVITLISFLSLSACSQKPDSEEIAKQVKAALAEEKASQQAAATTSASATNPVTNVEKTKPAIKAKTVEHAKPVQAEQTKSAQVEQTASIHKTICRNCGVVVSVKEIEQAGAGSGLGAVAGGVAGGLLGNQVGQGTGKDLATLAGVLGGAIAGNVVEKNMKKTKVYDVIVKMENGEELTLRHESSPGVAAGDKVKVEKEQVVKQ